MYRLIWFLFLLCLFSFRRLCFPSLKPTMLCINLYKVLCLIVLCCGSYDYLCCCSCLGIIFILLICENLVSSVHSIQHIPLELRSSRVLMIMIICFRVLPLVIFASHSLQLRRAALVSLISVSFYLMIRPHPRRLRCAYQGSSCSCLGPLIIYTYLGWFVLKGARMHGFALISKGSDEKGLD